MKEPKVIEDFKEFAALYHETQQGDEASLRADLKNKISMFKPDGFMILRCVMMDGSRFGQRVIIPYGGSATHKTVPKQHVSPRGLASDMSEVEAIWPLK